MKSICNHLRMLWFVTSALFLADSMILFKENL